MAESRIQVMEMIQKRTGFSSRNISSTRKVWRVMIPYMLQIKKMMPNTKLPKPVHMARKRRGRAMRVFHLAGNVIFFEDPDTVEAVVFFVSGVSADFFGEPLPVPKKR